MRAPGPARAAAGAPLAEAARAGEPAWLPRLARHVAGPRPRHARGRHGPRPVTSAWAVAPLKSVAVASIRAEAAGQAPLTLLGARLCLFAFGRGEQLRCQLAGACRERRGLGRLHASARDVDVLAFQRCDARDERPRLTVRRVGRQRDSRVALGFPVSTGVEGLFRLTQGTRGARGVGASTAGVDRNRRARRRWDGRRRGLSCRRPNPQPGLAPVRVGRSRARRDGWPSEETRVEERPDRW